MRKVCSIGFSLCPCFQFLILFFLSSCSYHHSSISDSTFTYQEMCETPYFLVILVEARHLDYSCPRIFFKTLAKHPSDGSKNGDVGHAWIYLQGIQDEKIVCLEGGHSGNVGNLQPCYIEGVFLRFEERDENPISYLWECQNDGFFQYGSGYHNPTFAAKVDLNEAQFKKILRFVETYDYKHYSITGNQCSSFAAQVAAFADLDLDCEITMQINPMVLVGGSPISLWKDPIYSEITFSSPDRLEGSLIQAVAEGKAEYAMTWYCKTHPYKTQFFQDLLHFPTRFYRIKSL